MSAPSTAWPSDIVAVPAKRSSLLLPMTSVCPDAKINEIFYILWPLRAFCHMPVIVCSGTVLFD